MTLLLDWATLNPYKFVFVTLILFVSYIATLGAWISKK